MPKVIDEDKVFLATIDLLVTRGYENTGTKQIAAAAGVNETTLFRKYGSKLGLVTMAVEQRLSDTPLQSLVYSGDLGRDLMAILQAYTEVSDQHGEIMSTLLIEAARNPALAPLLAIPWGNLKTILDIIERYQLQGHLTQEPPLITLNVLIGPLMVRHMFLRALAPAPIPAIDLPAYVDSLLDGRRPRNSLA